MFRISTDGIITMNRGEYQQFPLFINAGTRLDPIRYHVNSDDVVYFYVAEPNQRSEDAIIKKHYTKADVNEEGDVVITFESKDTFYLVPGTYFYEAKLVNSSCIKTVRSRTKLIILE